MGFRTGVLPDVDVDTFFGRPYFERIRVLATHWAEHGFGTPKLVHTIYIAKLAVLYAFGGVLVATSTSGLEVTWTLEGADSQAPKGRDTGVEPRSPVEATA